MTPQIAALRIGRRINDSETTLDTLLGHVGSLLSEMAQTRVATGVPAATGQRALARISAAQTKLVEARMDFIRAHEDLRRIAETGDMPTGCPDTNSAEMDGEAIAA